MTSENRASEPCCTRVQFDPRHLTEEVSVVTCKCPVPSWLLLKDHPRASGSHSSALVTLESEHKLPDVWVFCFFFPFKEVASLDFYVKVPNF